MKEREEQRGKVKQSLFPVSLFGIYIGVLFLMSGIHTGLIVFMNSAGWNKAVMTVVPMCYWGMVAMGLTLFTRWKVKRTYEEAVHPVLSALPYSRRSRAETLSAWKADHLLPT